MEGREEGGREEGEREGREDVSSCHWTTFFMSFVIVGLVLTN